MAKILYITRTSYERPNSGEKLRSSAIATTLKVMGHEVHSYWVENAPELPECNELRNGPLERVWRPIRFSADDAWQKISLWVRRMKFDVAIIAYPIGLDLAVMTRRFGIYTIVDTQNFELSFSVMRSQERTLRDQAILTMGEALYFRHADRIWAASVTDAKAYQRLHLLRRQSVVCVPNVIDFPAEVRGSAELDRSALFVGSFSYRPNVEAAVFLSRKVAPILQRRIPDAKICLVGRNTPSWFQTLQSANLVVEGEVAELETYYEKSSVVVAPLFHGGGTKLKIIEAMAHGKAIVASKNAVSGLNLTKREVVIARLSAERFASALVEVMTNSQLRSSLGFQARATAEEHFSLAALRSVLSREMKLAENR